MNIALETMSIVVICDRGGRVLDILQDDIGLCHILAKGDLFVRVVDRGSFSKALTFLTNIQARQDVWGCEMNLHIQDRTFTLYFAGEITDNRLMLIGSSSKSQLKQLCEERMCRTSVTKTKLPITVSRSHAAALRPQAMPNEDAYDQITRLNNDLIATQRELAKKNSQLQRLDEQKNQFLGMAAHDLRNPLNTILLYSSFLIGTTTTSLTEEQGLFLKTIQSTTLFMANLVNDLLDVAKIESGKLILEKQKVQLRELIQDNVRRNQVLAAQKAIQIEFICPQLPHTWVDPNKIEQVLNNLLTNAIKFSPPNTTVQVLVTLLAEEVRIQVIDQGPGIPANEMEKLFKPFGKTSVHATAGEQSTGLGLLIAKRIVTGHAGQIWVECKPGEGSNFNFTLPLSAPEK